MPGLQASECRENGSVSKHRITALEEALGAQNLQGCTASKPILGISGSNALMPDRSHGSNSAIKEENTAGGKQ